MSVPKLLIIGSKDFAQLVKNLAVDAGYEFIGFIDDYNKGNNIVGTTSELNVNFDKQNVQVAIGIGYNNLPARKSVIGKVLDLGFEMPNLIHPNAYIASSVLLGSGNIIMNNASIDHFSKIGDGNVFWPGSIISHDCKMGDNNFISPSATICGFCKISNSNFIGAGVILVDRVTLSSDNYIKAGALVKR
ncbi:hypothetical protein [Domibacillus iocasae]|uniref:PglD N-terminal domain-containing protein n=1 Tax=Domibacillus iocasae TaxID=1714016 RepID=A0A1E7DSK5_9BACI|nr:hypothetical protein [Domibacillus iocasae]OES46067.1 hypothetical protein BA724_15880 [Domibacillus iocasae]